MTIINLLSLILSALAVIWAGYTYFHYDRKLKRQEKLLKQIGLDGANEREARKKKVRKRAGKWPWNEGKVLWLG